MLERLCSIAERVCASMAAHMRREEAELFPLLERRLCHAQQRSLLWRTLRAMPLRLLERVMPWIVGEAARRLHGALGGGSVEEGDCRDAFFDTCHLPPPSPLHPPAELSDAATSELLNNIRLGAPLSDTVLVQLLSQWADKGRSAAVGGPEGRRLPAVVARIDAAHASPGGGVLPNIRGALRQQHQGESPDPESAASSSAPFLRGQALAEDCAAGDEGHLLHPSTCELQLLRCPSDGGSGAGAGGSGAGDTARGAPLPHSRPSPPSSPGSKRQKTAATHRARGADINHTSRDAVIGANGSSKGMGGQGNGGSDGRSAGGVAGGFNPIDHIFQFHSALKQVRQAPSNHQLRTNNYQPKRAEPGKTFS